MHVFANPVTYVPVNTSAVSSYGSWVLYTTTHTYANPAKACLLFNKIITICQSQYHKFV